MPGMTPTSAFPMMWAASGLPLPQLIDRIITTALAKRSSRCGLASGRRGGLASGGVETGAGGARNDGGNR